MNPGEFAGEKNINAKLISNEIIELGKTCILYWDKESLHQRGEINALVVESNARVVESNALVVESNARLGEGNTLVMERMPGE